MATAWCAPFILLFMAFIAFMVSINLVISYKLFPPLPPNFLIIAVDWRKEGASKGNPKSNSTGNKMSQPSVQKTSQPSVNLLQPTKCPSPQPMPGNRPAHFGQTQRPAYWLARAAESRLCASSIQGCRRRGPLVSPLVFTRNRATWPSSVPLDFQRLFFVDRWISNGKKNLNLTFKKDRPITDQRSTLMN
ncbi:uncharacterized protein LOC126602275 [Malus sylvestris]|uniref:uncharacterized protein LOC126602275 n=1 Tax=Malus sylvestris TaxID=3752 RepID=UPI0021AC7BD2|nr:uncharacterized protein LOC126602275 [Malus sylvestris]